MNRAIVLALAVLAMTAVASADIRLKNTTNRRIDITCKRQTKSVAAGATITVPDSWASSCEALEREVQRGTIVILH